TSTSSQIRSSAQGLFMMMTNGFGAVFGSLISGWVIDHNFTKHFTSIRSLSSFLQTDENNLSLIKFIENRGVSILENGQLSTELLLKDWHNIWIAFALYTLCIAILFAFMFQHKHEIHKNTNN